jgi:sugar phosphate isomerase/epimerase
MVVSNIAVSNIAWEPGEDAAVAAVLQRAGIGGVEVAPTKWKEHPTEATRDEIAAYRRSWEDRGLRIVSLQALLFGRPELQLFGDAASRAELASYLRRIIDLAADLGAHALVFGSPKNRRRGDTALADAIALASDFFRDAAAHAHDRGTVLCLEANPAEYGCDFITTTSEAVALCRAVNHPGFRVNADLGGMTLSGEDPLRALELAGPLVAHFHASEPQLAELGASADHGRAALGLNAIAYAGWVSVEMRAAGAGGNVDAVERAVRTATRAYGESW